MITTRRKRLWQRALAAALMVLMAAGGALAGKIQEFTADNVMIGPDGQVKSVSKLYFARDKVRSDMNMHAKRMGQGRLVMIYRRDKKQLWALAPDQKIYVQMPMDEREWEQKAKGMVKSENARVLGKETVNGYRCTKKQVTRKMEVMGMKMTDTQTIWVSDKIDVPIRTRSQNGAVTELRNIREGRPPAKVFEIPPGYKKVGDNMMALMMAMGGRQMPAQGQSAGQGSSSMKLPFKLPKGMKLPFGSGN